MRFAHSKGTPRALGDLLQLFEFALGQRAGVIEEAPNEGGLAVVNVTDNDDLKLFSGGA